MTTFQFFCAIVLGNLASTLLIDLINMVWFSFHQPEPPQGGGPPDAV